MKIVLSDMIYGCFSAKLKCDCGRCIAEILFDWSSDKISINDTEKIEAKIREYLDRKKINYCATCGSPVRGEQK